MDGRMDEWIRYIDERGMERDKYRNIKILKERYKDKILQSKQLVLIQFFLLHPAVLFV